MNLLIRSEFLERMTKEDHKIITDEYRYLSMCDNGDCIYSNFEEIFGRPVEEVFQPK